MTIFVVDDERVILNTLAIILRQAGYTVEAYLDGESALRAARLNAPQLLITDVRMAPMDGIELAKRISSIAQACKVLFFTAELTLGLESHAAKSWSYLRKPVHPRHLLGAIERLTKPLASSSPRCDRDHHMVLTPQTGSALSVASGI